MRNFTRKFLGLLSFLSILSVNSGNAQTNVSGNITTNTTWTKAASPYNLTSNIIVDNEATLTIEPGVVVEAKGHVYLSVLGKIVAVGTETDSIYFKGNGVKGFWTGIKIRNTGGSVLNTDYTYSSGSKFSYVSVKDADNAIYQFNCSLFVTNSCFNNNTIGIQHRSSSRTLIINSKFFNNNYGGYVMSINEYLAQRTDNPIDVASNISNLKYDKCDFYNNIKGVVLDYQNAGIFDGFTISNSNFKYNSTGIKTGDEAMVYFQNSSFINNKFLSNTTGFNLMRFGGGSNNLLSSNLFYDNTNALDLNWSYQAISTQKNIFYKNNSAISVAAPASILNSYFLDNKSTIIANSGNDSYNFSVINSLFSNRNKNSSEAFIKYNYLNISKSYNIQANNFFNITPPIIKAIVSTGVISFDGNYIENPLSYTNNELFNVVDSFNSRITIINSSATPLTNTPISLVRNITKSIESGKVKLIWTANTESDIAGYKIYYRGYTGYSYTNSIDVGNVTSTTLPADVGLNEDIAVTAYDASKTGTDDQLNGNESWYSTANIIPNAPTGLIANLEPRKIKLNWTASTSSGINNYNIYRSTDNINFSKIGSSISLSFLDSTQTPYNRYYYKLTAFDSLDLSYNSAGLESVASSIVNGITDRLWFVDSTLGNNTNGTGSNLNPYKTIQKAIDASSAGDTVYVKPGTYKEQLSITKGITVESTDGASKTIILQEALLDRNVNINNNFASPYLQVNIKGFKFLQTKVNRNQLYGINVEKKSFAKIESCYFEGFNAALKTYYGYYNVKNSVFYDNDIIAMNDVGDSDVFPIFQNCTIVNTSQVIANSTTVLHRIYNTIIVNDKSKIYNGTPLGGGTKIPLYNVIMDTLLKDYSAADGSTIYSVNRAEDMKFTNLILKDFSLSNSSPAIGIGNTTLSNITDFLGALRPNPASSLPDLGAYESIYDHPAPYLTDSTTSTQIKISNYQYPTTGLSKIYVYKGFAIAPTTKFDSISIVNSYTDTANRTYNKYIYYRFTSIGTGFNESGYSNEIKAILFTKPDLLSPTSKSFNNDTTIKFVWTKNENAIQYKLQYSLDSTFTSNVIQKIANDTSITLGGFKTNTNYYWRVLATDTIYISPWSSVNKLQTFISKPILDSIKSGYKNLYLYWTNKDTANTKYVKIYRDSLGSANKLIDSIAGNQLSYKDSKNVTLNQKYYYRIKFGNYENIESDSSNILNATPINTLPKAYKLVNKTVQNAGEYNFVKLSFSASGSYDVDGKIALYNWYVNDSLVNKTDSILSYFFKLGTNSIKLVVIDNDGGKDSSSALVTLSTLQKQFLAGILGGISAINQNYILTADTSYNSITGSSVSLLNRLGNTIIAIVVQSKIFTTPSVSSDSSIFITNGSSLNGYSKAGVSLWPTIPLGGISYVTPTIDSNLSRIYVGVSNKNFFAYDYKTGKNVWSIICDAPINTSAVISGDRKLIFTSQSGTLYGFDISKSDVQTTPKWKMSFGDIVTNSPAVDASSNIYVGTDAGRLIKFMLNTDGTVSVKWNVTLSSSIQTSPVIDADSNIYVGTEKGDFYKIDRSNGTTIWSYNVGAAIHSTPNISEYGTIYVPNMNGLVTAITTDKRVLWKYQDIAAISANSLYINNMLYIASEKGTFTGIYDNPNSVNVNTSFASSNKSPITNFGSASSSNSISFPSMLDNSNSNPKSIFTSDALPTVLARTPVWGTFQGDYRRTGTLSIVCPSTISITKDSTGNLIANNPYIQWYKDGTAITNAGAPTYKPSTAGSYSVKNNQVGCNSISSNSYYYIVTDVINLSAGEFIKISPNPFINQLNFDFVVKGYQKLNIEAFDIATGSKKASMQNLIPGMQINLSQLSAGTYVIKVSSNDGKINYQFKMIKL